MTNPPDNRQAHGSSASAGGDAQGQAFREALSQHQARQWPEAERLYRAILADDPKHLGALHGLAILSHQTGRTEIGIELLATAIAAHPAATQLSVTLANLLRSQGRLKEARAHYERALGLNPDDPETCCDLGSTLAIEGEFEQAAARYEQALRLRPDFPLAAYNLAAANAKLGRHDEAIRQYERALAIQPDFPDAHYGLAGILRASGRTEEAAASYRHALASKPQYPEALTDLGTLLHEQGDLDEAVRLHEAALLLRPDFPEALLHLGNAFSDQGKLGLAIASYERALALRPNLPEAHCNLGTTLHARGQVSDAIAQFRKALELRPGYLSALRNLGNGLRDQGRPEEAVSCYEQVLAVDPTHAVAYDNLLFVRAAQPSFEPVRYLELARAWQARCVGEPASAPATLSRPPLEGRRLRIGYVSGDFRRHAVSHFIEQLFVLHDRGRVEVFAYHTSALCDDVTTRLRGLADHWSSLVGVSDEAAHARILADHIDVLVDLSGHTAHNRLGVFARRAAPVQVHYLGFFASTGLSQMDYWIGDEILTPPQLDAQFQERLWRLPRVWVSYDAKDEAPLPAWSPHSDGAITLGSFNALLKLNRETIECWSKLLHGLPEAKLSLKTRELANEGDRRLILQRFADHGIDEGRLLLADHHITPDWRSHMAYYDRIDLALDPVAGLCGGTTSCDALWMGVPVIACEGDRMGARMTAAFLHSIGRPEWIARDSQDYIDKAIALARDLDGRKLLRREQRARMAASALCDVAGLARALEEAFLAMYRRPDRETAG